jgi:hypothetical protein
MMMMIIIVLRLSTAKVIRVSQSKWDQTWNFLPFSNRPYLLICLFYLILYKNCILSFWNFSASFFYGSWLLTLPWIFFFKIFNLHSAFASGKNKSFVFRIYEFFEKSKSLQPTNTFYFDWLFFYFTLTIKTKNCKNYKMAKKFKMAEFSIIQPIN